MKAIRIQLLGISLLLVFAPKMLTEAFWENFPDDIFVCSLPSEKYFVSVLCPELMPGYMPILRYYLSLYLFDIISLPYGEYDVEINSTEYTFCNTPKDIDNAIIIEKCQEILSKNKIYIANSDIFFYEVSTPCGFYRTVKCTGAEKFNLELLSGDILRPVTANEPPIGVVAYSVADSVCTASCFGFGRGIVDCDLFAIIAVALTERGLSDGMDFSLKFPKLGATVGIHKEKMIIIPESYTKELFFI